jgi:paraquat-inducible protein B
MLVVLVGMIAFLGSTAFFARSERYILFFDQSINGLQVGSPVKFRGVPIGTVERVMIRAEGQRADSTAIPVLVKLDSERLQQDLGLGESDFLGEELIELVERGLVAQLNLESFITGQLFVEFSFVPERRENWQPHMAENDVISEIPTLSSSLDRITSDIAQLIADFDAVDISRLNENVNAVLENFALVLADFDSKEFTKSAQSMRAAFIAIEATADSLNLEAGAMGDLAELWSQQLGGSLKGVDRFINEAARMIESDSPLHSQFVETLRELSRTAQSVRLLTDYLERNPNALLTGRPEEKE